MSIWETRQWHGASVQAGFTLVEIAIVIVIATLVLGALLVPLAGQIESRRVKDARAKIEEVKEAVLGFAAANGRLPCPAAAGSNGRESFCTTDSGGCTATTVVQTHGRCSNFFDGYLPAATLGISPTDGNGFAIDPWESQAGRWRYAVSDKTIATVNYALTAANGMRSATIASIADPANKLLFVCARGGSTTATSCGAGVPALTEQAPIVIWSVGRNASATGASTDEQENGDADAFFVSHDLTDAAGASGEFDDIVGWLSLHVLFSRMLSAGQL
jgi:prepilin-type N-terminal cleavage/methylation domain-containing protein